MANKPLNGGHDTNLELFVNSQLHKIHAEVKQSRSKDGKALAEQLEQLIEFLTKEDFGKPGSNVNVPFPPATVDQLLSVLQSTFAIGSPKLIEPALSLLHKLVAYAYLQGESGASGRLDDPTNPVPRVIRLVTRCGDAASPATQLQVIKALLTFTTAEHFIAHGDCLMSSIRAMFNLAIGADTKDIQTTAKSALLQMVNTVVKKVGQQVLTPAGTPLLITPTTSGSYAFQRSPTKSPPRRGRSVTVDSGPGGRVALSATTSQDVEIKQQQQQHAYNEDITTDPSSSLMVTPANKSNTNEEDSSSSDNASTAAAMMNVVHATLPPIQTTTLLPGAATPLSPPLDQQHQLNLATTVGGTPLSSTSTASLAAVAERDEARAARLASLAENADINGLAQALDDAASTTNSTIITGTGGGLTGAATTALGPSPFNLPANIASTTTAGQAGSGSGSSIAITTTSEPSHSILSHLLPTRLHSLDTTTTTLPPGSKLARQETPPDPRRALMKDQRAAAWRSLTIIERDALLVLTSMSKLAARDGGSGANTEDFTYKGKMLALELLVAVMTNPTHDWSHIRQEFALQLRQPLCLAVLKNCALTGSDVGVAAAGKILSAMVLTPALRQGLKAEVGALYPLLLLKPLESWWEPGTGTGTGGSSNSNTSSSQLPRSGSSGGLVGGGAAGNKGGKESIAAVEAALQCLLGVSQDPQTLVDIFVNYDCSLQAANLFERSVKVLARIVTATSSSLSMGSGGGKKDERGMFLQKTSNMALQALLAIIESLDTWAGPIKSAAAAAAASAAEIQDQEEKGEDSATSLSIPATAENSRRGESLSSLEYNTNNTHHQQQPLSPQTAALKPSPLPTQQLLGSAALQEIHAKKELKSSLAAGLDLFSTKPVKAIRHLVASKVISDPTPPGIAAFIRENINQLDKEALGELFGHHESEEIDIMHAYINVETYQGQLIDEALRGLLSGFRLPGEAQKIDRIMEKFAEKYCTDNPGSFPAADAAYLLAFAIIMLNTDAHNPMADRRINVDDFVTMCNYQTEGGEFAQILPTPDLEGIYKRIVDKEIGLPGSSSSNNNSSSGGGTTSRVKQGGGGGNSRAKLAAAVGLTQLVMPIWSGAAWDKQLAVRIERQRLETFTAQLLASGQGGGGRWSAATHAEHARPMMQVAGQHILAALSAALSAGSTLPEALKVLASIEKAVKLAALLQLEDLTEKLMSALANAASVTNPAPHSTPQETKQVASLSRLVGLGSSMESGMLGASGWVVLLRTLSQLEKLKAKVIPTAEEIAASSVEDDGAGGSGFNRFLQKMGLGSSGTTTAAGTTNGTTSGGPSSSSSSSSSQKLKFLSSGPLHILDVPGAGFALWAETAGANPIDACYSGSSSLDGDAVLSFMRALCAVSQEELTPPPHQGRPSVHMLQRAIECAHHNLGRIRLVWSRLWSIVSQHLVSAACHHDADVAMYAVDALRQLTAKLLAPRRRAELTNFARQGEALRPFAAVLRHCDNPVVKDLAVSCVSQAVAAHSAELGGPGWRSAIEALAVAAGDPAPEVVVRALGAMQLVFNALYAEKNGHTCLTECAAAALEALGNDAQSEELALGAVDLFQILAGRLSYMQVSLSLQQQQQQQGGGKMGGDGSVTARSLLQDPPSAAAPTTTHSSSMTVEEKIAEAWGIILAPLAMTARQDPSPRIADAAAAALFSILAGGGGGGTTTTASSSSSSKQQQQNAAAIWNSIYFSAVVPLLQLPDDEAMKKWYRQQMGRVSATSPRSNGTTGIRSTTSSTNGGTTTTTNNNDNDDGRLRGSLYKLHYQGRAATHHHNTTTNTTNQHHQHNSLSKELSWEGLIRLRRHAHTHFSQLWPIIHPGMIPHAIQLVESYILFTGDLYHMHGMTRIMNMLPAPYHYTHHHGSNGGGGDDEYGSVPGIGIEQLHSYIKVLKMTNGNSSDGWALVAASLKQHICPVNPLMHIGSGGGGGENREVSSSSLVSEVVMRQCQVAVQIQRLIYWAMSNNSMSGKVIIIPLQCQLDMLSALEVSVGVAMDGVNSDVGQQREMGVLLKQKLTLGSGGGGGGGLHHHAVWYNEEDEDDDTTTTTITAQVDNKQQQQQPLKGGPKALLYRQEVQGGLFLIKLLQQICTSTNSSSSSSSKKQQSNELVSFKVECEKRLSAICLKIITRAAQRIVGGGTTGGTIGTTSSGDVSESDTVRYPLVVGALEGCMSLSEEGWRGVQGEMFGSMARLVCCPSLGVRQALQRVMKERGAAALKMKI